jgi:DNA-binding NarL/FixJ family response regulator
MIILVLRSPPGTHPIFKDLTARERQVAGLIADGLGNRQIAAALVDTVDTVDKHVRRILAKTGLSGRAAMVALWHTGTVHGDVG